jgi:hypothetical protein
MIWLGILIGIIIGVLFTITLANITNKEEKVDIEKYIRRGLLQKGYTSTDNNGDKIKIDVMYEIGELESTGSLEQGKFHSISKIEVIELKVDKSEYNSEFQKKRLTEMIDKSWVNSKDITWITTTSETRNKKIDQILN